MLVINQLKNMVFSKMYVSSNGALLLRFEVPIAKDKKILIKSSFTHDYML